MERALRDVLPGGLNGQRDTARAGDDVQFVDEVQSGPNRVCDTTATGDDTQIVPVAGPSRARTRVSMNG